MKASIKTSVTILCVSAVPVLGLLVGFSTLRIEHQALSSFEVSGEIADTTAEGIWKRECSSCHGKDGKGKTKAGRRAKVKNFTDAEYQSTWTDEEAFNVIYTAKKNGEKLKNKKPFSEKLTKDEIELMVAFVREFVEE